MSEIYVLAAFRTDTARAIKYRKFKTLDGITNALADVLVKGADYVSIRRVVTRE